MAIAALGAVLPELLGGAGAAAEGGAAVAAEGGAAAAEEGVAGESLGGNLLQMFGGGGGQQVAQVPQMPQRHIGPSVWDTERHRSEATHKGFTDILEDNGDDNNDA